MSKRDLENDVDHSQNTPVGKQAKSEGEKTKTKSAAREGEARPSPRARPSPSSSTSHVRPEAKPKPEAETPIQKSNVSDYCFWDYAWRETYQKRACLVRLKTPVRKTKDSYDFDDYTLPTYVTYFTCKDHESLPERLNYQVDGFIDTLLSEDAFAEYLSEVPHFDATICGPWKEIKDYIASCHYERHMMSASEHWRKTGIPSEVKRDLMPLAVSLNSALTKDMTNGCGKDFIFDLLHHIMNNLVKVPMNKMKACVPSTTSETTGVLEYISENDEEGWLSVPTSFGRACSSPCSEMLSSISLGAAACEPERHAIVSDYVVYFSHYPGHFLLNFEVKMSHDNWNRAVVQCCQQMLTEMHFQRYMFGVVLSPSSWSIILLEKCEESIKFLRHEVSYVIREKGKDKVILDVQGFVCLFDWLYRIISWGKKIERKDLDLI